MASLILFFILGVWLFSIVLISWLITKIIKNKWIRYSVMILIIPILFLLPVLDELIGKNQFKKLCIEQAKMQVDEKNVSGKLLIPMGVKKTDLQDYILQTEEKYWSYKDSNTGEILISWKDYESKGGWLSKAIGFPEGNPPYTFDGVCLAKGGFEYVYGNNNFSIDTKIK